MTIYTKTTIDLYNKKPPTLITAKQGDTGRGFIIEVFAGNEKIDVSGETINVYIKKPDGTVVYASCEADDGNVKGLFDNQMLAVPGDSLVELEFVSGEEILTSPVFTLRVNPTIIDENAIESQSVFTALETALATLSNYDSINTLPLVNTVPASTSLIDSYEAQENNKIAFFRTDANTTDTPPNIARLGVLSFKYQVAGSGNQYGGLLGFSGSGLYYKQVNQSTWSDWGKVVVEPTQVAVTSGQEAVSVTSGGYYRIGNMVHLCVRFSVTSAVTGNLTEVFSTVPRSNVKVRADILEGDTSTNFTPVGTAYVGRGQTAVSFYNVTLETGKVYSFDISYNTY